MSRPGGERPSAARGSPLVTDTHRFDPESVIAAIAAGLLATSWLVPAEGAFEGVTGWRALAWLMLASVWGLVRSRRPADPESTWWNWILTRGSDLAVALIVGGQIVGGLLVLMTEGQKRFAANLLLEWIGLGSCWWVLRGVLASTRWRSHFGAALVAVVLAASALGLWQHYLGLPRMAAEYGPKLAQYRQILASGQATSLAMELAAAGIPTTEPGLTLFEKRLMDSREPFGMFALANTFGGLLAATLVWLTGAVVLRFPSRSAAGLRLHWGCTAFAAASLAAGAWCLVLTKSRTAVLGGLAGLAVVSLCWLVREGSGLSLPSRRRLWIGLGIAAVAILVIPSALIGAGVWDAQVLQEAPKSLRYRWQYWVGGGRLIAESPWLGIGLGQFRNAYLRAKLPEASEEIADPHNLWVDAWVNGGLLSVIGLSIGALWLVILTCETLRRPEDQLANPQNPASGSKPTNTGDRWSVVLGVGAAFPAVFAMGLSAGAWDDRLVGVFCVWMLAIGCWFRCQSCAVNLSSPGAALAGALTLVIHLHGAGGFQMPGVLQWGGLLVLLAGPTPVTPAHRSEGRQWSWPLATAGLLLVAGWGLWNPHMRCGEQLDRALQQMSRGRIGLAQKSLELAAKADRWSPEPWRQQAELHFGQYAETQSGADRAAHWDQAVAALREAQRRDPASPHLRQREGDYWLAKFQQDQSSEAGRKAAEAYRRAIELYPTNAMILAQWAQVSQSIGDTTIAREAAQAALQQDDLNHVLGHVERRLPVDTREKLVRIAEVP
ncbi:MAG: O-antigen ligase family protein [Planctomycetaceae bacterium]|nr:O-antigen ligase family protein [Planctomycetaceae bacterium]